MQETVLIDKAVMALIFKMTPPTKRSSLELVEFHIQGRNRPHGFHLLPYFCYQLFLGTETLLIFGDFINTGRKAPALATARLDKIIFLAFIVPIVTQNKQRDNGLGWISPLCF